MTRATTRLSGSRTLVVGLGDTGLSCVRWLKAQGAEVRGIDSRAAPPHAERLRTEHPGVPLTLGRFDAADFAWADMLAVSPGVSLNMPEIAAAAAAGKDIVGDVELFARALAAHRTPQTAGRVLAVTGSNGKSTVVSLTGHLCRAAGQATVIAGNIGLPVLDALSKAEVTGRWPQLWVLELSSYQLETTASLAPLAATVLNVSQDHMDRYAGMADYTSAKARIFGRDGGWGMGDGETPSLPATQILNRDDPLVMAMRRPGHRVWTFGLDTGGEEGAWGLLSRNDETWLAEGAQALAPVSALPLAGLHNAANALASLALARAADLPYPPMLDALASFKGLPHRVELVDEFEGVTFYDDSKGTNVGATLAALTGFNRPVVLIAGGDGKGQDFSPLRQGVDNARAVVLIGRDAPLLETALAGTVPVHRAGSLDEAVQAAFRLAREGDAVLLSPACASFDMFRNYVHRAEVFVAAVRRLGKRDGEWGMAGGAVSPSHIPHPSSPTGGGRVS
jgi:UDP-N-acetylmuramoylalanine--D-glutamate ligase